MDSKPSKNRACFWLNALYLNNCHHHLQLLKSNGDKPTISLSILIYHFVSKKCLLPIHISRSSLWYYTCLSLYPISPSLLQEPCTWFLGSLSSPPCWVLCREPEARIYALIKSSPCCYFSNLQTLAAVFCSAFFWRSLRWVGIVPY